MRPFVPAVSEPYVTITLPGSPRGKGRPRFSTRGGFVTAFTDKATVSYENALKAAGIAAMAAGGLSPLKEALGVQVMAYMAVPESWSKKKRAAALAGDIMPTSGFDADNLGKSIDGLNYHPPRFRGDKERRPIIWHNDANIVSLQVMKLYDADPRLVVSVFRWFA
jgi:Holliday junction resolvase RusA-like endonuclease